MKQNSHIQQNIIYVNFAPYENAGKILDYILIRFQTILLFSFNFHHLGKNQKPSTLRIYRKKKIVYECRLFQTPTIASIAFILLPVRSLVIFAQLLFHLIRLKKKFGPYDIYFTVNAFTAWTGNILRRIGIVKKTIFWVWDYYPPIHKSKITMFMRWLYWMFDKPASLQADKTIFLNKRLEDLRKDIGVLPEHVHYSVVPIGTNPISRIHQKTQKILSLIFLGVLKKSQGLDLLYDADVEIHDRFPRLTLHIVGGGPDAAYFRKRAKRAHFRSVFHGYIPDEKTLDTIISACHIGLATYMPEDSNVSYYSDPSKIKKYISLGLPVITTSVFGFSKEIHRHHAGVVIDYYTKGSLVIALTTIVNQYRNFRKCAVTLARQYHYQNLYARLFNLR